MSSLKLQLFGQYGTIVGSAKWQDEVKQGAINESEGECNGYRKKLVDEEGNVYYLKGTFQLSKSETRAKDGTVKAKDPSVTSRFSLVAERDGKLVSQIELTPSDITRVTAPASKKAKANKAEKPAMSEEEILAVFK